MGNPAGVRRDFERLEERRFKAFGLLKKGLSEAEVARQVAYTASRSIAGQSRSRSAGARGLKKPAEPGASPV